MAEAPARIPARCKTCDAPIWWARSSYGALGPYDATPVPDGTWQLTWVAAAAELQAAYKPEPEEGRNRYRSHFATCPQAAAHRGGGEQ